MNWWASFFADRDVIATLIAAVVGFGGVIATLIIQHRADIVRDQVLAEERRSGIAGAFAVEVRAIRDFAIESVKDLGGEELTNFLVPTDLPFVLFEALKSEIDALSHEQIQKVVACYVWLPEITRRLRILAGSYAAQDGVSIVLLAQHAHIYEHLMNQLKKLSDEALEALERPV